jgi:hypothetical protein
LGSLRSCTTTLPEALSILGGLSERTDKQLRNRQHVRVILEASSDHILNPARETEKSIEVVDTI